MHKFYVDLGLAYGKLRIAALDFFKGKHHQYVTLDELLKYKKSDTVFICGSGASVCQYTEAQLDEIREADSIGFNFWMLHPLAPTIYTGEIGERGRDTTDSYGMVHNLELKLKEYENTLKLFRARDGIDDLYPIYIDGMKSDMRPMYSVVLPMKVAHVDHAMKIAYRHIVAAQKHKEKKVIFLTKRASIFSMIYLAAVMDYRKIVLCGVDMNNSAYFYESMRESLESKGFFVPPLLESSVHRTNDPQFGAVTAEMLIYAIDSIALKPRGIDLYVAKSSSLLAERLPVYWGDEA